PWYNLYPQQQAFPKASGIYPGRFFYGGPKGQVRGSARIAGHVLTLDNRVAIPLVMSICQLFNFNMQETQHEYTLPIVYLQTRMLPDGKFFVTSGIFCKRMEWGKRGFFPE
ncbi:MAG: hypothetical protein KFF46_06705, partial [Desulfobacterales bacterium]|nr:hypothetical protein [Desulfobacterales bacterium]